MPASAPLVSLPIMYYERGSANGTLELFFEKGKQGIRLAAFLNQREGDITQVVDPGNPQSLKRNQLIYPSNKVLSVLLPNHRLVGHVLYVKERSRNAVTSDGTPIPVVPRIYPDVPGS